MQSASSRSLAGFALVLMSLIWGYNWVVMKQVTPHVDPFVFSALRTLLGAVSLFVAMLFLRRPLHIPAPGQTLLLGLLQTAAFTALIQWALVEGGAGKTAVLVYTMPFWLLPLAWLFLGEHIRRLQWLAIGVSGLGLVFFLEPWRQAGGLFSNLLALAAGLSWALATVVAKRLRSRHECDLLGLTAWQMLFGALALTLVVWQLPTRPLDATPYFFAALAYNAILATGLAWVLWLYVLKTLPASLAGLSSLGIPAIGVLAGWLELGEIPSRAEFAGMALIALGLLALYAVSLRADRPLK